MDEQRERPDHGDEDDIFVGIVQQKGRCEEEHYRSDSEKDECYGYKLNFYKRNSKNLKKIT